MQQAIILLWRIMRMTKCLGALTKCLSALTKSCVFLTWILSESLLSRVGGGWGGVVVRIETKVHQSAWVWQKFQCDPGRL